ncbi:MAG: hypothetical protein NDJ18_08675, partial [candidate division Zixibacteria bacterium]|nr:hypothetical protein [candidate division Zixibacteria bacterium]
AVRSLKERDLRICGSVGMQTWELITASAALEAVPLRCYLLTSNQPAASRESEILRDFGLKPESVEFVYLDEPNNGKSELAMAARDRMVVDASDMLLPISIRPSGHMADLLERGISQRKEIVSEFQLSAMERPHGIAYSLDFEKLNPTIDEISGKYLIHWTRATNSRWPDERSIDYYSAIINSLSYPRTGLDTLCRILDTMRLIGSARHMPQKMKTVAFSSLSPREVVPLMRYRARYGEMSFEPYGIGIAKELAPSLDLLPVIYYSEKRTSGESGEAPWRFQSMGIKTDWREEQEYRHAGDLPLGSIPRDALHLFCRFPDEAERLQQRYGIQATSLGK